MTYSDEDLIKAALMDDPEEQKEESSTVTTEVAGENEAEKTPKEVVTPPEDKVDNEDEGNEDTDKSEEEANEDAKSTRKERREERKKNFLESIKADNDTKTPNNRERLLQGDPNFKPLDYTEQSEYDAKQLEEDRSKYGNNQFSKGAETERYYATQERFWDRTEFEGKLLENNPKYAFLDETNPDTFNADKAEELNGMYLELVGFDAQTNTVRRTDLSYDKFVRHEVERMERWAGESEAESSKNIVEQASRSGIRPSGSSKSGIGKLRPGDISKMSAADVEKNEAEIDRQILAML